MARFCRQRRVRAVVNYPGQAMLDECALLYTVALHICRGQGAAHRARGAKGKAATTQAYRTLEGVQVCRQAPLNRAPRRRLAAARLSLGPVRIRGYCRAVRAALSRLGEWLYPSHPRCTA